jgi:hypothetical protein
MDRRIHRIHVPIHALDGFGILAARRRAPKKDREQRGSTYSHVHSKHRDRHRTTIDELFTQK